jgi:hypothetical protein
MPRHFPAVGMTEAPTPELEARIAAFESASPNADFDSASWFWMLLLGIIVPVTLLIIGWFV